MLTFCTLFDENYIDKGLVLYRSLKNTCKDGFVFHVLCMTERCYDILNDLKWESINPIRLSDFENDDLLKVKPTRSVGEYCWTCDPSLIKFILEKYNPDYCTYLDADMAFYDDPQKIIDEMVRRNASVSIVGHRFDKEIAEEGNRIYGRFCVQCNTFKNDEYGKELLNIWVNQCIEHCSADGDGIHWGDQKYMDNWVDDYPYVIEIENLGAGVAKWNLSQYKLLSSNGEEIVLKCNDGVYRLLFYHYQGISFLSEDLVRINVFTGYGNYSKKIIQTIYKPYLKQIGIARKMLQEKYGIVAIYKHHPGYNNSISFLEKAFAVAKNVWRLKFKYFKRKYDFIKLNEE